MTDLLDQLDFQDRMIESLESNVDLFSTIDVPIIRTNPDGSERNGIAFMLSPVGPVKEQYYDGSMLQRFAFQLTAKSDDQLILINTFYAINSFIYNLQEDDVKSQNDSFKFNEATVSSTPVYLGVDNGRYIYAGNYEAELLINLKG